MPTMPPDPERRRFPNTQWSLLNRVQSDDPEVRRQAFEQFVQAYFPVLRGWLYRKGIPPGDIEDVLHDFLAERILEHNLIAAADRTRGRFRTLLATALQHFVISRWRRETGAGKHVLHTGETRLDDLAVGQPRGPGTPHHRQAGEAIFRSPDEAPDAFDVAWAMRTLELVLASLREQCQQDRPDLWEVFDQRVLRPWLRPDTAESYTQLVARLGYASPGQAHNALQTALRRFQACLHAVVGSYATDDEAIEEEIRDLKAILRRAGSVLPPRIDPEGGSAHD